MEVVRKTLRLVSAACILTLCIGCVVMCVIVLSGPLKLEAQDMDPLWSPDGKQIVFVCYRREWAHFDWDAPYYGPYTGPEGYNLMEICTVDPDGKNRRQLTDNRVQDFDPSWSPDGSQIVFVSSRGASSGSNIFIMDSDGSNLTQLTQHEAGYNLPRWSPDGRYIAYIQDLGGDLYVMRADGSQLSRLTEIGGVLSFNWSPAGESIVLEGGHAPGGIYVVNIETRLVTCLTDNQVNDSTAPVWAPDGRHVLFKSDRELYIADTQMHEMTAVSTNKDVFWGGEWSPDGQFVSYLAGTAQQSLFILNLKTGTSYIYPDLYGLDTPKWSPDSCHLVYSRIEDRNGDGFGESKLWIIHVDDGTTWTISD